MTPEQLAKATGATLFRAAAWLPEIAEAMAVYGIDTPARQAAFLAQVGHESGGLMWTTELWGPTIAQQTYEGRKDLGNTQPGDGSLYRGHGLIQTTGRANHAAARDRLRAKFPDKAVPDFVLIPSALAEPEWAALSAADFWAMKNLNALADRDDFLGITKRINGGVNGYSKRVALYEAAQEALA